MTFFDYLDKHPGMTFALIFLVGLVAESVVAAWRRRG